MSSSFWSLSFFCSSFLSSCFFSYDITPFFCQPKQQPNQTNKTNQQTLIEVTNNHSLPFLPSSQICFVFVFCDLLVLILILFISRARMVAHDTHQTGIVVQTLMTRPCYLKNISNQKSKQISFFFKDHKLPEKLQQTLEQIHYDTHNTHMHTHRLTNSICTNSSLHTYAGGEGEKTARGIAMPYH